MIKKNDEFIFKIEDMGVNGEGIGHVDGLALFVKDAIIGDTVRAKVMKMQKNYGKCRLRLFKTYMKSIRIQKQVLPLKAWIRY